MSAIVGATLPQLEAVIQRGKDTFIEVGNALMEIRDRRLYREAGYTEFGAYCRERWDLSSAYATRHIQAAEVVAALPTGNGPANEAQARALVPLWKEDEAILVEVWADVREQYGEAITAEKLREAVAARLSNGKRPKPRPPVQVRTFGGLLAEAVAVAKYRVRDGGAERMARELVDAIDELIDVLGEDIVQAAREARSP